MYGARGTDPVTSHLSATDNQRRLSQRLRRLLAYHLDGGPLSDEQAAELSGIDTRATRSCWWKRSSELREAGLIDVCEDENGNEITVTSAAGRPVEVCRITLAGRNLLREEKLI